MVSELIELLQEYPAGLRVVVNGYEDGYDDGYDDLSPQQISLAEISLNTGKHHWEGRHGVPRHPPAGSVDRPDVAEALVLCRVSY